MIKFRVRDPETKKIVAYEWVELSPFDHQPGVGRWCNRDNPTPPIKSKEYSGVYPKPGIHEQFTNKTDQNKVELYDGDYLDYSTLHDRAFGRIVWDKEALCWAVENKTEGFLERLDNWGSRFITKSELNENEVIPDKQENKE